MNFSIGARDLARMRFGSQNARHVMAKAGVARLRAEGLSKDEINRRCAESPRGFYSWVIGYGYEGLRTTIESLQFQGDVGRELRAEFDTMAEADKLFSGFSALSRHQVLDLGVNLFPGLSSLEQMAKLFPHLANKVTTIRELIERNIATPVGQPSPFVGVLKEDHPGWATETPDVRNIRGKMAEAVQTAEVNVASMVEELKAKYGPDIMSKIKYIVVCGIGANDMYMKDLPRLVNSDPNSSRKLYSIFEPGQLKDLPAGANADNTLYLTISRSGGTQESVKTLYFAKKQGLLKYVVGYANSGLLKTFVEKIGGITQTLPATIGGRYMLKKGRIVLEPLKLAASAQAYAEYTSGLIDYDNAFWPVGPDDINFQLAAHLYYYRNAYNIAGIIACANEPTLEAGLRQFFQLHNEAVGKIKNGAIAFGPGMEMQPFAHAGADGVLGAAVSALLYGMFVFDTSYKPQGKIALTAADLLSRHDYKPTGDPAVDAKLVKAYIEEEGHVGLTPELLRMACVFPNWAKFSYSGGPNMMITMDGPSFRRLALLSSLYQDMMYNYLIMNETNPDSNPNVAVVRSTTGAVESAVVKDQSQPPIDVITQVIPEVMKG